jgi:hypothetical protein
MEGQSQGEGRIVVRVQLQLSPQEQVHEDHLQQVPQTAVQRLQNAVRNVSEKGTGKSA